MTTVPGGTLIVSIDIPTGENQVSRHVVSPAAEFLARTLEQLRIPATWSFGDPARTSLAFRLASSRVGHEIGLLGEPTWLGRQAGRTRFVRELTRRVETARDIGLSLTTLALSGDPLRTNLDVLAKQRISVVRSPIDCNETGFVTPRALRFGVWEARSTLCVPNTRWWPTGVLAARWTLGRTVTSGAICQLAIDTGALQEQDAGVLRQVQKTLRYAVRLREENLLGTRTLSHLSTRFQANRRSTPLQSILRKAA